MNLLDECAVKKDVFKAPNNRKIFYMVKAKDLADIIHINSLNRAVKREHVEMIMNNFESYICDPITVAELDDQEGVLHIIDGQHRFCCITEMIEKKLLKDKVIFRVDYIRLKNKEEFSNEIIKFNRRYNFAAEQIEEIRMSDLIKEVNGKFNFLINRNKNKIHKNFIQVKENGERVNRPFLADYIFVTAMSKTLIYEDKDNSPQEIANKIFRINEFIRAKSENFWNPDEIPKDNKQKLYVQAREARCVLGVDPKLRWMKLLDCPDNRWDEVWASFFKPSFRETHNY